MEKILPKAFKWCILSHIVNSYNKYHTQNHSSEIWRRVKVNDLLKLEALLLLLSDMTISARKERRNGGIGVIFQTAYKLKPTQEGPGAPAFPGGPWKA